MEWGSRGELEQVLKRLLGAAHDALDAGLAFTVLLCDGLDDGGLSAGSPYRIESREALDALLWEMLRQPPGEANPVDWERFLEQEGVDAGGVLLISPDGILPAREVCGEGEDR
ncbi:MAG: hypothetical protein LIO46_02520 [Clostridiales bacterium]|nr:hypothetical protein [Clostridiales bacterium]